MPNAKRMPKRFLEGAPDHVADIFDSGPKFGDRFTVVYRPIYETHGRQYIFYRGMSGNPFHPQGVGLSGEFSPYDLSRLRESQRRRRIKWAELPPQVQACVMQDKPETARLVKLTPETYARVCYALSDASDARRSENECTRNAELRACNESAIKANNAAADQLAAAWNAGKPV